MIPDAIKKNTAPERRRYNQGIHDRFDDTLDVHTTPDGTQYVLPIDLLLTQDEMRQYLANIRGEKDPGTADSNGNGSTPPA